MLGDRPAAHGIREDSVGVVVIEDKEVICSLPGGGW